MSGMAERMKTYRLRKAREINEALQRRVPPLVAHYGQEPAREARRARFYDDCAKVFGWTKDRVLDPLDIPAKKASPMVEGFGGRGRNMILKSRDRVMPMNAHADPFEYLSSCKLLGTRKDPDGFENARYEAGRELRDILVRAEPKGMKTVDFGAIGGGNGMGFNPTESMIDAIKELRRIRYQLQNNDGKTKVGEPELYKLLERLVYLEDWKVIDLEKKEREAVLQSVYYGLDCLALMWGRITPNDFSGRWG